MRWSEWLFKRVGRTDAIALSRLMTLLFEYLTVELHLDKVEVATVLLHDYQRGGRSDKPSFLCDYLPKDAAIFSETKPRKGLKRQARHLAVG